MYRQACENTQTDKFRRTAIGETDLTLAEDWGGCDAKTEVGPDCSTSGRPMTWEVHVQGSPYQGTSDRQGNPRCQGRAKCGNSEGGRPNGEVGVYEGMIPNKRLSHRPRGNACSVDTIATPLQHSKEAVISPGTAVKRGREYTPYIVIS